MDNLAKQYIKNAKALFPLMNKDEKKYFGKLSINVEDYCEAKSVSSMEDLYRDFGTPADVANSYFSNADLDYILKQIKRTKIIKISLITIIIFVLLATATYCYILYDGHRVYLDQQIFMEETFIEDTIIE